MSAADRCLRGRVELRLCACIAIVLTWAAVLTAAASDALPLLVCDLPVTNGLIRWWPNLFDARDEITGQEGIVMGLLPAVQRGEPDETPFDWDTGFVQLRPAVTNEVFTFSFWVRLGPGYSLVMLIGQESSEGEWFFGHPDAAEFFIHSYVFTDAEQSEPVKLKLGEWQHVAIARKSDGRSIVWLDGARVLEGKQSRLWPARARWLTAGNSLKGDHYVHHYGMRASLYLTACSPIRK